MAKWEFDDDYGKLDEQGADRYLYWVAGAIALVAVSVFATIMVLGPRKVIEVAAPATAAPTTTMALPPTTLPAPTTTAAPTTTSTSTTSTTTTTLPPTPVCVPGSQVPQAGCVLVPPADAAVAVTVPLPPTTTPVPDRPATVKVASCERTPTGVSLSVIISNPSAAKKKIEVVASAVSGDQTVGSRTWKVDVPANGTKNETTELTFDSYRASSCRASIVKSGN